MRVVLDTNIFISALMSHQGFPVKAIKLWTNKKYDLVTSTWQIEELRRVSRYENVKPYITRVEVGSLVNALHIKALVLKDLPDVDYSADPDDNPIIATAILGEAQYIVSGDKDDILALNKVKAVRMLPVRKFVELFD